MERWGVEHRICPQANKCIEIDVKSAKRLIMETSTTRRKAEGVPNADADALSR